jgi:hypothetical protein
VGCGKEKPFDVGCILDKSFAFTIGNKMQLEQDIN